MGVSVVEIGSIMWACTRLNKWVLSTGKVHDALQRKEDIINLILSGDDNDKKVTHLWWLRTGGKQFKYTVGSQDSNWDMWENTAVENISTGREFSWRNLRIQVY